MKINRFLVLALVTLVVVGAMGAVTYRTYAQNTDCTEADESAGLCDDDVNEVEENISPPADASVTAEDAIAIAVEAYPGAKAQEVEYEREGGVEGWEVELDNGLEVVIDPQSGDILSAAQDD